MKLIEKKNVTHNCSMNIFMGFCILVGVFIFTFLDARKHFHISGKKLRNVCTIIQFCYLS